jgi:hypothetical protein
MEVYREIFLYHIIEEMLAVLTQVEHKKELVVVEQVGQEPQTIQLAKLLLVLVVLDINFLLLREH